MTGPAAALAAANPRPSARAATGVLAGCLVAVFAQMLDLTMVTTALPALSADLGARDSAQLLIASAYSMAFACGLLPAARIGDTLGRRRTYLTGMYGLCAAAIWSAAARGGWELVAARGAQGLCAALVSAQTLAIIAATFEKSRHPTVFGYYGATAGLAAIVGPLCGGALVVAAPLGLGWRAVFLVTVPLALIAAECMRRCLPADPPPVAVRPDLLGVALSTPALLGVLYPVARSAEIGWPPSSVAITAAAVGCAVAFVVQQRRRAAARGAVLLRLELFTRRGFAVGAVLMLLFSAVLAAFPLIVSVYLQTGLGWSATRTGATIAPYALAAALGALMSPIAVRRYGYRALTGGMALFAAAIVTIALLIDPFAGRLDTAALAAPVILAGLGLGVFAAPLSAVMIAEIEPELSGAASGTVPAVQQIGSAVGPAVFGAVMFAAVSGSAATSPAVGYSLALRTVLWLVVGVAVVLTLSTLLLPREA